MKKKSAKISPSAVCIDCTQLAETLGIFEKHHIELIHVDIMDGSFVPNFGLGTDFTKLLRRLTSIPLDIHLMISEPELKIPWLPLREGDMVTVHYESSPNIQVALDALKVRGCKPFLAINPPTPASVTEDFLDSIDGINLLMVNPGFSGQKMVPGAIDKAKEVVALLERKGREELSIEVDGNITLENAGILREIGADIFVAGTSSVFIGGLPQYPANIYAFRQVMEQE